MAVMNTEELVARFKAAFKEPDKVKAEEYQKIVEANATKAADSAERLTIILLGLVMLLILTTLGTIKKVDLGFVEIEDPFIILVSLPVLVAYIHYDLVTTLSKFDLLSVIHKAIIKQRHPPIHEQRLTKYFLFLPTLYENKYHSTDGIVSWTQSRLWFVEFFLVTIFIPFGSEFIAYTELRDISKPEYSLLLIASIGIT